MREICKFTACESFKQRTLRNPLATAARLQLEINQLKFNSTNQQLSVGVGVVVGQVADVVAVREGDAERQRHVRLDFLLLFAVRCAVEVGFRTIPVHVAVVADVRAGSFPRRMARGPTPADRTHHRLHTCPPTKNFNNSVPSYQI